MLREKETWLSSLFVTFIRLCRSLVTVSSLHTNIIPRNAAYIISGCWSPVREDTLQKWSTLISQINILIFDPWLCLHPCWIENNGLGVEWQYLAVVGKWIWRWPVPASSYNSNKLTNQMQQFYKFITLRFVSLNMFRAPPRPSSGTYNCINSHWFYLGAWW